MVDKVVSCKVVKHFSSPVCVKRATKVHPPPAHFLLGRYQFFWL